MSLIVFLLCIQWRFKHLDGREIAVKTRPGQIILCETVDSESGRTLPYITSVKDEGMPSLGNPFIKGSLYIAFHVKFPTSIPPEIISQLNKLLPDADICEDYDPKKVEGKILKIDTINCDEI